MKLVEIKCVLLIFSIESDIVLSGLEPLTLYAVVVTYETQTGESPASREVQVMTLEGRKCSVIGRLIG